MSDAVQSIVNEPVKAPQQENVAPETAKSDPQGQLASNKDDKISSRLEMLIRREQQALARERIAKASETESARLRQELESERARIAKFNSVKSNPKLALEELGLTYDEITKAMLQDGELPPEVEIKKLRGDLDGIKQEREDERLKQLEQQKLYAQAQETQAIESFKSEINTFISDNTSRYELINFDSRQDEVYELIDVHYSRTQSAHAKALELEGKDPGLAVGKVMKIKEAADKIEEYYEKKEQEKKKLSKLQTIWGAVPKESLAKAVAEARGQETKKPQPRTLTNNLSAQGLKPSQTRPKDEDSRVAKIIADWKASRGG